MLFRHPVSTSSKNELVVQNFSPIMACFLQDVDKATSSRINLEKKLEQLEVEIEFLKRVHQQVDDTFV